mmetsp:Transcript_32685/g.77719  ORF Transcript_32685/g.77719 Transcript_32685/m.77719 type:complete len:202 (+) Transcript_32685:428-1033(+)
MPSLANLGCGPPGLQQAAAPAGRELRRAQDGGAVGRAVSLPGLWPRRDHTEQADHEAVPLPLPHRARKPGEPPADGGHAVERWPGPVQGGGSPNVMGPLCPRGTPDEHLQLWLAGLWDVGLPVHIGAGDTDPEEHHCGACPGLCHPLPQGARQRHAGGRRRRHRRRHRRLRARGPRRGGAPRGQAECRGRGPRALPPRLRA